MTTMIMLKKPFDQYPNITAWFNKVAETPGVKEVHERFMSGIAPFIEMLNKEE